MKVSDNSSDNGNLKLNGKNSKKIKAKFLKFPNYDK